MKKEFMIGGVIVATALGGILLTTEKKPIEIKLENPQVIEWVKPTTDAGWAEDVKAENIDIRSTKVLTDMIAVHKEKLEQITSNNKKVVECPECVKYEIRHSLEIQQKTGQVLTDEIETLTEQRYQDELTHYYNDIETLTRSIERMDNELELRDKGFVKVDDKENPAPPLVGGSFPEQYIRHIID